MVILRKREDIMKQVTFNTSSGSIQFGEGLPAHFIAEIGLNHNGSMELAKGMILEAAKSGATMVKFQKRFPKSLATSDFLDAPFLKCPLFGSTQREVRERLELTLGDYKELEQYAQSLGMMFSASAFDIQSLEFLKELTNPIIKIASHSITNGPLMTAIAQSGLPVICSLGGASQAETDFAYELLKNNPLIFLHCVSAYPTPDDLVQIDTITYLKKRYDVPVGFSSHEVGIDISVAATVLGACLIERHFTFNRSMVGLDHGISLEPHEFCEMVLKARRLEKVRGIKTELLPAEYAARNNYHVGIYTTRDVKKGDFVKEEDIACMQPLRSSQEYYTGLEVGKVVGKEAKQDIGLGQQISRGDF
jgi:sialic acid synthase SpsE